MSIPDGREAQPMNPWQMAVRMTLIESAALPKKPRSQSLVQNIEENEELKFEHGEDEGGHGINQVQSQAERDPALDSGNSESLKAEPQRTSEFSKALAKKAPSPFPAQPQGADDSFYGDWLDMQGMA